MEKRARMVLLFTAVLLSGMLVWVWARRPPEAVKVKAAKASVQDIYNSVTAPGIVEAADSTAVCPLETASVAGVCVSEGDIVEKGDLLCVLAPVKKDVSGAAGLEPALEALSRSSDKVVNADVPFELTAPCGGAVMLVPEAGDTVWAGLPCVRIADLSRLQVRVKTPELYAGEIKAGQPANVTASASGEKRYAAVVESVAPAAVRTVSLTGDTGTATVEAVLPLRGDVSGLRPGYTASAKIFTQHHPEAVVAPFEAVCQRGEEEYVFCVEGSYAVMRAVKTGYLLENVTEIEEGLSGGEYVILSPSDELRDGALIEVEE